MSISFSQRPGRHERHYRRKLANPLFDGAPAVVDDEVLLDAQRQDHDELLAFLETLRATVQRAVELRPNEGSEVILEIKGNLDRLYEASAGLAEDHGGNQAAIRELLEVVMRNIERGAAGDAKAIDELAQERIARDAHFALLRSPLVADLLHPQSCIAADELAPSLLSADEHDLADALQLFDRDQLTEIHAGALSCLSDCGSPPPAAGERLAQIAEHLTATEGRSTLN